MCVMMAGAEHRGGLWWRGRRRRNAWVREGLLKLNVAFRTWMPTALIARRSGKTVLSRAGRPVSTAGNAGCSSGTESMVRGDYSRQWTKTKAKKGGWEKVVYVHTDQVVVLQFLRASPSLTSTSVFVLMMRLLFSVRRAADSIVLEASACAIGGGVYIGRWDVTSG